MKSYMRLFIILVTVLWTPGVSADNLISNGDFENTDKEGVVLNWKNYYHKSEKPVAAHTSFNNGSKSLYIGESKDEKMKTNGYITKKECAVEPGQKYQLSFYAKSDSHNQQIEVYFYTYSNIKPHYYRKNIISLSQSWEQYKCEVTLPSEEQWKQRKLHIRFSLKSGDAFIDDAVLQKIIDTPEMSYSGKNPVDVKNINILENPGFELDWQSWFVSSYRPRNYYYSGKDIRKPIFDTNVYKNGSKSLNLPPYSNICSKRYPYLPGKKYTLSFYARREKVNATDGRDVLQIKLITPNWTRSEILLKGEKNITNEWQRYSLSFLAKEFGSEMLNSFYVNITNENNQVWVDSLKLELGEVSDYNFPLQVGFFPDAENSICYLGDKNTLDIAVQSDKDLSQSMVLYISANDVYGKTVWAKTIPINNLSSGLNKFPITIENIKLGVIDLNAVIKSSTNKMIANGKWRYWCIGKEEARLNPYIGYENRVSVYPVWAVNTIEELFNKMGAGYERSFLWPEKFHPLAVTDSKVLKYLSIKNGIIKKNNRPSIMTAIGYFYKDSLICHYNNKYKSEAVNVDEKIFQIELNRWVDGFADILKNTAGAIGYYEIQNEINLHRIKKFANAPSDGYVIMTIDRYVQMLKAAREAVDKVSPKTKIGINLCRIDFEYLNRLINADAFKYVDFFSFHSYQATPETPPVYKQIKDLKKTFKAHNIDVPIFNSEQYFGILDFLNVSGEFDQTYYSESEFDLTGRLIQNFLHHLSERIPYSMFAINNMTFMLGNSNNIYYYFPAGAVRNISQLLIDLENGSTFDVNDSLRFFLFTRKDGKKIVSVNTKRVEVAGTMAKSKYCEKILDINGNEITGNVSLGYLPCFIIFPAEISSEKVIAEIKSLDYSGLNSPMKTQITVKSNNDIVLDITNTSSKAESSLIKFKILPDYIKPIDDIVISKMKPLENLSKIIGKLDSQFDWRKKNILCFTETYKKGFIEHYRRLPSLFIKKKLDIKIDGDLSDWAGVKGYQLGGDNLSLDFSRGKSPNKGVNDLSAVAYFSWDHNNLYLALNVVDDKIFNKVKYDNMIFKSDSFQIYFDLKNDSVDNNFKNYDYNDVIYQVGFTVNHSKPVAFLEKNPEGRFIGASNQMNGIDDSVKVVCKQTSNGYIYEMAFPKETLPFLNLINDTEFALDILINDNDGNGRKQGLTLGSTGAEPNRNVSSWKGCILR